MDPHHLVNSQNTCPVADRLSPPEVPAEYVPSLVHRPGGHNGTCNDASAAAGMRRGTRGPASLSSAQLRLGRSRPDPTSGSLSSREILGLSKGRLLSVVDRKLACV